MKHDILTILVGLLVGTSIVARAAVSYDQIDALGGSRSRHISEESQIQQLMHLLQQGLQQFNNQAISVVFAPTDRSGASQLPLQYQASLDSLFSEARELCPTIQTEHPGWVSGALDWFDLRIDSVAVSGDKAQAIVTGGWADPYRSNKAGGPYTLNFDKIGGRWSLHDFAPVLEIVADYLSAVQEPLRVRSKWDNRASGEKTYNQYAIWLQHMSKHLLNELWFDQGDGFKRFTKTDALNRLGGRVFSCTGNVSSFYYQGDPLIRRTVSLAAVSDHCWQRFVVADRIGDYITAKGKQGSGNNLDDFAMPGGLEFFSWGYLFVCDRGNNRIKIVGLSDSYPQHVTLEWIVNQTVNDPIDLDVAMDGHLIVAEAGSNTIACFCEFQGCSTFRRHNALDGLSGSMYIIDKPTAVCFDRDPLTSAKLTNEAYLIDRNGSRLMAISDPFDAHPVVTAVCLFPDPIASATDVAVDNKGQVWVVDNQKGRMYKFDRFLNLLAIHGEEGDGDAEYLYPYGLSFSQAYQYVGEQLPPVPIPAFAEAILTEQWGNTTGVRRLVSGVDVLSNSARYSPRLVSGTADFIAGQYFTTDYADLIVEFFRNSVRYDSLKSLNMPPGLQNFQWYLTPTAPSGTYEVRVTARSVFTNSNTSVARSWIEVDTSIANQVPVVRSIFFPDGDTCFIPYVGRRVEADAHDSGGSIAGYRWSCDNAFGNISDSTANPVVFTAYPKEKFGLPRDLRVRVVDNYGVWSSTVNMNIDHYLVNSWAECPCTHCGDANGDAAIDQSDAVLIIRFIFAGGPAPGYSCGNPIGLGDANGDGSVDISDAIYLINYIFAGGPAPHCP